MRNRARVSYTLPMTPDERLQQLVNGKNPRVITQMASGFAVMSDVQFLPGYCLLLAYPKVGKLNDLNGVDRASFLADMASLGDAVLAVTGAVRVNYAIYGNLDPFLHAHVWPRFTDEPEDLRTAPPLTFPASFRNDPTHAYDPAKHDAIRDKLREILHPY